MKKFLTVLLVLITATALFANAEKESASNEKLELVIYCAANQTEGEAIIEAFNAKYPNVRCTLVQAGSGDIVTRVNTEWPKPDGDVIFLMASENLDQIYDKLHSYKTVNDADIKNNYKDKDYKWYASSMPLQAIMYNTDKLKGDMIPSSWADLADPKYKGMIELANPATSGSAYAQLYQMNYLYGWSFVEKVAKNGIVFVSSSTKGPTDVSRGEYAFTITGEANIAQAMEAGNHVAYVLPSEGTGLRTEGCAILENCKNTKAAEYFMDFMTSAEGFNALSAMYRRPVSEKANLPTGLVPLSEMKFFEYNAADASSKKKKMQADFGALL